MTISVHSHVSLCTNFQRFQRKLVPSKGFMKASLAIVAAAPLVARDGGGQSSVILEQSGKSSTSRKFMRPYQRREGDVLLLDSRPLHV